MSFAANNHYSILSEPTCCRNKGLARAMRSRYPKFVHASNSAHPRSFENGYGLYSTRSIVLHLA